jgi:NrS-1  polymerase HBD domain
MKVSLMSIASTCEVSNAIPAYPANDHPRPPSAHVADQAAERIPSELRALNRWVVWRWVWKKDKNKGQGGWDKPPVNPHNGRPADATDQAAWMTFDQARALAPKLGSGIGFALGTDGPYCGVDLDKVIDDQGEVAGWAQDVVDRLASYTEITPSLRGLRVWIKGRLPRDQKGKTKSRMAKHPGIEFYDADRYFTVTGERYPGTPTTIEDRSEELAALHAEIFAPQAKADRQSAPALADDDTLLERARDAKNGAKFTALFDRGDISEYNGDASAADLALCSLIAFWAGPEPARIERIFNRSALGRRDKWQERLDYREMTIGKALEGPREFYTPPAQVFANSARGGEEDKAALRMGQLAERLDAITPGWPKRLDERLFIAGAEDNPVYLDSAARLFAFIDSRAQVAWTKGARFITQERFYEHLRMTAERYDSIETLPHWPPMPGTYYMHRPLPEPCGKLAALLDFFYPATPLDRELIKALILSPFWGGQPGHRPAFLITGEEQDPGQGRGVGKTTLVDIISQGLAGGSLDVSPTDEIARVKTRLLSGNRSRVRFARLDNVKTLKFSWADLEGLITAPEISGHALFLGEGRRPNVLTWAITLNGASLSKDLAQRVIPVRLGRPQYDATWESRVREFIQTYRWELIAEIGRTLEASAPRLTPRSRWSAWEQGVLARVEDPAACQDAILERQHAIDTDGDERDQVAEYFAAQLRDCKHNPETAVVLIPAPQAAAWLSQVTRKEYVTNAASAYITSLCIPHLTRSRTAHARGWIWRGAAASPTRAPVPLKRPDYDADDGR